MADQQYDVAERARWEDYQHAISEALSHTSTEWAPWHVIPADRKWFARIATACVLVSALMDIDPQYPRVDEEQRRELLAVKEQLEAEAPRGAVPDPNVDEHEDQDQVERTVGQDGRGGAATA